MSNYQPEQWTITLNKYQRDNLLWLIMAMGYPAGSVEMERWRRPELAGCHNGDWVGQLYWMLYDGPHIQPNAQPNPNPPIQEGESAK